MSFLLARLRELSEDAMEVAELLEEHGTPKAKEKAKELRGAAMTAQSWVKELREEIA
jgi:hypothetical protein